MSGAATTDRAQAPATPPAGLRATARIRAAADGRGGTALPLLAGEGPLALRRTRSSSAAEAGVMLVGAMSAPLGGDHLTVEATAGPGAHLALASAAATLALPGRSGEPARYDVHLTLEDGASVRWLPEPLVSVRGSDLRVRTRVRMAPTARLVLREEQVLGRTGEAPGLLRSRLAVERAGTALLDQELACGPGAPGGWDGPAGLAGHRALGQLLVVEPAFAGSPPAAAVLGEFAVVTPLAGPAVLVTALAPDALRVRELLDAACRTYGR
ncbi:urease accessory protein UreD [Streptomyces avidinii]|uniref:Urease accessory protein UreD n=1 Tax=Streptomyces avidinii TaxID=1895 RepID=A0ABS4LER5_STRAV|nr:urease accessory protein UreD [Streptomyces avidinii]MBP2040607.1 urease accessory protein [Streptomyces avidinii]GGZ31029.1 urease accessory protein UreD [Streptomyces avidinii]